MAVIFGKWHIRWKLERLVFTDTLWVKYFAQIALSCTVFETQAFLCFAFFKKIWKFKMAVIFGKWHIRWKLERLVFTDTLWVKYFAQIALSCTVFKTQAFLCFAFLKKIWKFKMAVIFGKWHIRWKLERLVFTDTLWVKYFAQIVLSCTVFETQAFLCFEISAKNFAFFVKNSKNWIWPSCFGEGKFFWKIGQSSFIRYPVGQKFPQNRSISHG